MSSIREKIRSVRWHQNFELQDGVWTEGVYNPNGLFERLCLPPNMSGMRVLDLGARDGFHTMKCEQRGAHVVSIDYLGEEATGFHVTRDLADLHAEYYHTNIYNLGELELGTFDIVLFLGVIYHLPDPYLAMEIVAEHTKPCGWVYIESTNCQETVLNQLEASTKAAIEDLPIMVFAGRNSTSFWDPNTSCLKLLSERVGIRVHRQETWGARQLVVGQAAEVNPHAGTNKSARGIMTP